MPSMTSNDIQVHIGTLFGFDDIYLLISLLDISKSIIHKALNLF